MAAAAMATVGGLACAGLVGAIALTLHFPSDTEPIDVVSGDAPALVRDRPIKVLSWNVQFSAGRANEFFYDGGTAVSVTDAEVEATLAGLVSVIQRHDPDIVVLQEVDRGSRRTGYGDQYIQLLEALGYPSHASTPYHRAPYVPAPGHEHMGRVDMHLAVFSRYALASGTRHQLSLIDEPWWRQLFNLRRALMEVHVPIAGGGELVLLNTHLSAFSGGDGTLSKQIGQLQERMEALGHTPYVLAGDLNALPPGDDRLRLPERDQALYEPETWPVAPLFEIATPAVPLTELRADPQPWRTYVDFGETVPDRTIDYLFYGPAVEGLTFGVDSAAHGWSDHLPLVATLVVHGD
ncbi:MAG: endonuclease/exonuclease/phosphatase family metal-dependent hydrolase [Myxococcota bacterium]|jgi:endonuclease/exonuclease/phosphatase family metal-dependent hydrolase